MDFSPHFRPESREAPLSPQQDRKSFQQGLEAGVQPGAGAQRPGARSFGFSASGRPAPAAGGGSELEIGVRARARGAARTPPGEPRGAGRAGKGLHVPGRLAPGRPRDAPAQ